MLDAYSKALKYLSAREYSGFDLVKKLEKVGFSRKETEAALETLRQYHQQSDARFADIFVRSKSEQGQGPERIRLGLEEHGVAPELIKRYLEEAEIDWVALSAHVRIKKFGPLFPHTYSDQVKQMRFLQYRGFRSHEIRTLFKEEKFDLA